MIIIIFIFFLLTIPSVTKKKSIVIEITVDTDGIVPPTTVHECTKLVLRGVKDKSLSKEQLEKIKALTNEFCASCRKIEQNL